MIQNLQSKLHELTAIDRAFRRLLLQRCRGFSRGSLSIVDADGMHVVGNPDEAERVVLWVRHPRFYRRVVMGGTLAASESWMDAEWDCSDLVLLIRLLVRNLDLADRWERHANPIRRWRDYWWHWWRGNSRRQAQCNIRAHYDLGNDFFELFLDPSLNYSSAMFLSEAARDVVNPSAALAAAQLDKMEAICRRLQLRPGDRLLEIGTGWGALACHAAKYYGCQVVTTTISPSQYEGAQRRVQRLELTDRVTVLNRDYRDLEGKFDKIVSVEMIEAVGDQYYPAFFAQCGRLLKPDGLMLLQAITIVDSRYHTHLGTVDFICKYIFPGGSLPCLSRLVEVASTAAGLRLASYQEFSTHYARTLQIWRERFHAQLEAVRALGFDDRFVRMWDYYLAYCEAGFLERQINVGHLLLTTRSGLFDPATAKM
ncbi:MAG TPA: cyclopropane-fatty-acyl-phospholipid synthase family protein [Pirellulaceae bacterium]|nr:cyclopropane-fatty-acyl-phospholipid synthase family protein [Pirellulaceae bacterium]